MINKYLSYFVLSLLISSLLMACKSDHQAQNEPDNKGLKEPLIEANKQLVKTEDQHINDLLERYKWDMATTETGLRYMIRENGDGPVIETGDQISADYTVRLITGDEIYSSADSGPLQFVVGNAQVISGLEEGVLLLKQGDKAVFIIPSHLAYGLIGDQEKIGSKATLIYEIEINEILKTNN